MNAIDTGFKAVTCAAAALALTAMFSWSFVESTSVVRWVSTETAAQLTGAAADVAGEATRSALTALVD